MRLILGILRFKLEISGWVQIYSRCLNDKCLSCDEDNTKCSECSRLYWGRACENLCPAYCDLGCYQSNGTCKHCQSLRWGDYCNLTSSDAIPNCLEYDNKTGECISCLQEGFWGKTCNQCEGKQCKLCNQINGTCEKCLDGYWGKTCLSKCPEKCSNGVCETHTGHCLSCKANKWGRTCNQSCIIDHCHAYRYDLYGNKCPFSQGPRCSDCNIAYWGEQCLPCPRNCIDDCSQATGKCVQCKDKVWGPYCNITCSDVNCRSCGKTSGVCLVCLKEHWGDKCQNTCDLSTCEDEQCNKTNGTCQRCKKNYWGDYCNQTCDIEDCASLVTCTKDDYCNLTSSDAIPNCLEYDNKTGECISCLQGFWGKTCNQCEGKQCKLCNQTNGTCEKCLDGYWGKTCLSKCPEKCSNGVCEKHTGHCLSCKANKWGRTCNQSCIIDHCHAYRYDLYGNKCPFSQGPRCSDCNIAYWGEQCLPCPRNCIDDCSQATGKCVQCKDKVWGPYCNITCSDVNCRSCGKTSGVCLVCLKEHWGDKCQNTCDLSKCEDEQCNKTNGTCQRCKKNYWGDYCNQTCDIEDCASLVTCTKDEGPRCYYCVPGKWGTYCKENCPGNCSSECKMSNGQCMHFQCEY